MFNPVLFKDLVDWLVEGLAVVFCDAVDGSFVVGFFFNFLAIAFARCAARASSTFPSEGIF